RPHDVALTIEVDPLGQLLDELGALGPRPDEAHITEQHVPQLRDFIDPGLAQETADGGDPGIAGFRPYRAGILFRVVAHRAKLVDDERLAMTADAALMVQRGARRGHTNRDRR